MADGTYNPEKEISKVSITIVPLQNSRYKFELNSHRLTPLYFYTYRYGARMLQFPDSAFLNSMRLNIIHDKGREFEYRLDCGTGAGLVSINPYESFSSETEYDHLVLRAAHGKPMDSYVLSLQEFDKYGRRQDTLSYTQQVLKDLETATVSDSIDVRFYFMAREFLSSRMLYAESNVVKLGKCDVLQAHVNRYFDQ